MGSPNPVAVFHLSTAEVSWWRRLHRDERRASTITSVGEVMREDLCRGRHLRGEIEELGPRSTSARVRATSPKAPTTASIAPRAIRPGKKADSWQDALAFATRRPVCPSRRLRCTAEREPTAMSEAAQRESQCWRRGCDSWGMEPFRSTRRHDEDDPKIDFTATSRAPWAAHGKVPTSQNGKRDRAKTRKKRALQRRALVLRSRGGYRSDRPVTARR